jgi:hypothetical protein
MLVPLIITPLDHLPCVRFIFFFGRISKQAYVVMDVKVEERARLSPSLVDDKVVERVMLLTRLRSVAEP